MNNQKKCYPCNGRGYSLESTLEADGSTHREKIPCSCCDGLGELVTVFRVPSKITTPVNLPSLRYDIASKSPKITECFTCDDTGITDGFGGNGKTNCHQCESWEQK